MHCCKWLINESNSTFSSAFEQRPQTGLQRTPQNLVQHRESDQQANRQRAGPPKPQNPPRKNAIHLKAPSPEPAWKTDNHRADQPGVRLQQLFRRTSLFRAQEKQSATFAFKFTNHPRKRHRAQQQGFAELAGQLRRVQPSQRTGEISAEDWGLLGTDAAQQQFMAQIFPKDSGIENQKWVGHRQHLELGTQYSECAQ